MHTGSAPTASVHGTWAESLEVWDEDTDTLYDLTAATEITIKVRDPRSHFDELVLTKSGGDVTVPQLGIIEWLVPQEMMGALAPNNYELIILLEDASGFVLPLFQGLLPVVE